MPNKPRLCWPRLLAWSCGVGAVWLATGCDTGVGSPPTVPLETASPELVELFDDLLGSVNELPHSAAMRGRLGMAYEVNDFYTEAAATYAQAAQLDPEDFRWRYFRAVLVAESGDFESALPLIEEALALDSGYVPAWLYRGVWLNALGRYVEAREAFAEAHALGATENADAGTARALVGEGRFEEAVALLLPLVEQTKHPQAYRLLGRAYQALGRPDDARIATARGKDPAPMTWRDPIQHQKWRYEASLGRRLMHGERLLEAGRFEEAVDVLEPIRERGVQENALYINLALAYARSGRREMAIAVAQEGMAGSPDNYRYDNVFAGIYQNDGDDERAMHHLRRSVELQPAQVWPYERLARLLMDKGAYVEALAAVDDALRYGSENHEQLFYTAGLLEGVQERWPEAVARFEQATALDASYTMAYVYLGRCLAEMGRFEEARQALAWAARLDTHPTELADAETRVAKLEAADGRAAGVTARSSDRPSSD